MAISAKMVNELRQKTGAGIMDCKRALQETDGDLDKAVTFLREKGMASASKKASRVAAEGKIEILVAGDSRSGAVAEINCETDFVGAGEDFLGFCKKVAEVVLESGADGIAGLEDERKALVAKTGENMVVRRQERFALPTGKQGRVETYIHMGGKIGVMVEVTCESDGKAKAEEFTTLCHDLAMHVAAASPQFLNSDEVPADVVAAEKDIYKKQALDEGKPEKVVEKMVEGRLRKYFGEFCLVDQPWVREQKMTITKLIEEVSAKIGEKIAITRFVRFQLGEGIEKKSTDLAAEVAAQLKASQS